MADRINDLRASVNERFNAIDAAFVSQREYFTVRLSHVEAGLEAKLDAGFSRVERKLNQFIDAQLQRACESPAEASADADLR